MGCGGCNNRGNIDGPGQLKPMFPALSGVGEPFRRQEAIPSSMRAEQMAASAAAAMPLEIIENKNIPKTGAELTGRRNNILGNLLKAAGTQPLPFKWAFDGATKLLRSIVEGPLCPPEITKERRKTCGKCPHSTKNSSGQLSVSSQCMAVDAAGKVCGCFLLPKTDLPEEACPIGKWASITLEGGKLGDLPPKTP